MKQFLKLLSIAGFTLITGCAMINKAPTTVPKSQECTILPLSNLSDTPLAGESCCHTLWRFKVKRLQNGSLLYASGKRLHGK